MTFLAYGEDALTLYALLERRAEVLAKLGDDTDPAAATVIYRPSFGRRGASAEPADPNATPAAQFGEFDAILATPRGTYLIETKWRGASEVRNGVVTLRPEQVRRHQVMRTYIEQWRSLRPGSWADFAARASFASAGEAFRRMRVAPSDSTLRKNLEFVLRRLEPAGPEIRDVLLFVCAPGFEAPQTVKPEGFELVCVNHAQLEETGYVELPY